MKMRFGIIGNSGKKTIGSVIALLAEYFFRENIEFYIDSNLKNHGPDKLLTKHFIGKERLLKNSDMIISLGGDGTFLRTARIVGKRGIPILGINLGTLGFMAEVNPDSAIKFISNILKGKYKVHDLCLISARKGNSYHENALNEIVIDKRDSIRMIELEIFYKDETVGRFFADGVLVSTPTGSTGYSLSAGGPIISPYSKVFIITPICPHTLNFRPVIVPDDGIITIKTHTKGKVRLTADGFTSKIFTSPAEFQLSKSEFTVKTIKKINKTYFGTLNSKLLWGADTRNK
jgi:NAD+ kinase